MNCYATVDDLKKTIEQAAAETVWDDEILSWLQIVSADIEQYTGRRFFPYVSTKSFRVQELSSLMLLDNEELQSVSSMTLGGSAFAPAYQLLPLNEYPKWAIECTDGTVMVPGTTPTLLAVTGVWGHSNRAQLLAGITVQSNPLGVADTTLTVQANSRISAGAMLRIGSEYIYVSGVAASGATLTIERAENGSTAAQQAQGTAIYLMLPPEVVRGACRMQAARIWKRRKTGFSNVAMNTQLGSMEIYKGIDADVARLLGGVCRIAVT